MLICRGWAAESVPGDGGVPLRVRLFAFLMAAVVGVAACAPQLPVESPTATAAPTELSAALPATAAPQEPAPAEGEAASAATPTARPGLQATDPTTVALGAGRPALVEFFAFW
jgi:hypothetical protein